MYAQQDAVSLASITLARHRLAKFLKPTPLKEAPELSKRAYLKLECFNVTGSFKVRGAINAMLSVKADVNKYDDVVAASSGNHAQALAYASSMLNIRARIYVPKHTPKKKILGIERYQAEPVLFGDNYDECELESRRIEQAEGITCISPYNNADVVSGAGTLGLELFDQLSKVERVIVPVSGGGLIAGIATAMKAESPFIEIVGVCAENAPSMYNVFYGTNYPQVWDTVAEALSGEVEQGSITIDLVRKYVDRIVLVTEEQIEDAMRSLAFQHGIVVEGGGAVGYAAAKHVLEADTLSTVIVISGANVDKETVLRVLNKE